MSEGEKTPDLTDPNVVHVNMLRGALAKPTWAQIEHLYPEARDLTAQLEAALERAGKAEEERDKLATFARERIREAWAGCEEGDEIQDHARKLGMIVEVPGGYDPEKHGAQWEAEDGEPWFVFADWLDDAALKTGAPSNE